MFEIIWIKVLKTIGGKSRLLKELIPIIRYVFRRTEIRGFLDLFGGGNKFIPQIDRFSLPVRIYNEFDTGIANLMGCLANWIKTREVIDLAYRLQGTIQSQEDFDKANVRRRSKDTPQIESAALTIIIAEFSRAADRTNFCKENAEKGISYRSLQRYKELVPIMRDVTVTNGSYEWFFEEYGHRSDFLAVLDPPYVDSDIYLDGFDRQMHVDMTIRIVDTKMKVILCGTDNTIYDYLVERGWYKYRLGEILRSSSAKKGAEKQEEYIWTNFPIPSYLIPRQD
ncbi:DNA adenine methylase [Brevibacillus borstelensis]|uniref:DNA adenine methylase n=1 Tax=Brevibacillus borstelensis TaxID=45462 RepID=UPI001D0B3DAA|nr:DNA adenine methylase [Brevibacillus borstelensis]MCC0567543.1 DNA adenine methylase [Brevibacillus borstelensis]